MKLALLATLVTFAGSIAGFQAVAATGDDPAGVTASPPAKSEQIVVQRDADCPRRTLAREA